MDFQWDSLTLKFGCTLPSVLNDKELLSWSRNIDMKDVIAWMMMNTLSKKNIQLYTCPVQRPTTRSAINVSSVSPLRWLTITPQPLRWASLHLKKDLEVHDSSWDQADTTISNHCIRQNSEDRPFSFSKVLLHYFSIILTLRWIL